MKTYTSTLYFNYRFTERINVGLIMFNDTHCIVKIKQSKMNFVKLFKPEAYDLFKLTVSSFKNYYTYTLPTLQELTKTANYNNGIFKLDIPTTIDLELTTENFNKLFNKVI